MIRFWFEDDVGLRPVEEIRNPTLRDAVSDVRSFVETAVVELREEDLAVVFWENESGALKMSLRGPDDVVARARALIGERAAVPPAQH